MNGTNPMSSNSYTLRIACDDQPGIVSAVTTAMASRGANIAESNQFWDRKTNKFFLRMSCLFPETIERDAIELALKPSVDRFNLNLKISDETRKPKIIIMVSKFDHAMLHLLYQIKTGWLDAEVVAIVSNHEDARKVADQEGIPFHCWPVNKENKAEQEEKLAALVQETGAELVILARYMQVISNELSTQLFGMIINIHHSFLPSFKGAKPYHQAYDRGVKLIGATAHYVTPDLDEGPIIEQDVIRVTHADSVADLVRKGRDVERSVLARAVRWHLEDRVLVCHNRCIVFA